MRGWKGTTMMNKGSCLIVVLLFCALGYPAYGRDGTPQLVEVAKIWDQAQYNSFVDLVRFDGQWFCTLREGERHVYGEDGTIRVITSPDGVKWDSATLLEEEGIDLRDPKINVTPDGRLMLVIGGSEYDGRELVSRQPRVSFSADGRNWSPLQKVLEKGDWLWRVTWFEGTAYGVSYVHGEEDWLVKLFRSSDGIEYDLVTLLDVPGSPNETTLRFQPDGEMIALVRREGGNRHAWIGTSSRPPYTEWSWTDSGHRIGGPNFIILPGGGMWASGRAYGEETRTVLAEFTMESYKPVITFPSGGDTSYPGMAWHEGMLWVAYYSSHEGKSCIYLAKVRLPE